MTANDTIRLLILNDSRAEVERLVSMLKNAGLSIRAQHVESEEALAKLLQENAWDLMVAQDTCSQLTPVDAIRTVRRLNKDVPMILICDEEGTQPVVNGLKIGAADVVRLDEDQHLLLVLQREMSNREQRQIRRRADQKLREAERRSQQLLDSSRDAIAFVQDGMYLYANQSFAEMFGYDDRDDIECMPVIDMISDADQEPVKQLLKEFTLKGDDAELSQLQLTTVTADGRSIPATIDVANAIYDEEPCIQFLIRAKATDADSELLQAELQKVKDLDHVTNLYNRPFLMDQLEREVSRAVNNGTHACLLYIEVDDFADRIQGQMGLAATDGVVKSIASALQPFAESGQTLARLGDDSFALLAPGLSAESAVSKAQQICKALEQHIIDVEGRTVQATCTVGVSTINETSDSSAAVVAEAQKAVQNWRKDNSGAGNGARLFEPELSEDEAREAEMTRKLKHALANNGFKLLYQPIVSLRGSDEELYEVLLRMVDEQENLSPTLFAALASQMGAMVKIDRWVILQAIKALAAHRGNGFNTRLVVNLSKDSLCDASLVPWLAVAFKASNLRTDALIFQVQEDDVTNHLNAAKAMFEALAAIGGRSCISNFGCSLNPFKTLEHASPDLIKVHGSFTQDIQNSGENPESLNSLITRLLEVDKLTIIPEVENASVLATLWQTGVHYIQGRYLQAPAESMNYEFAMDG